ncbi:hypothetical protein TSUD_361370 [Trifolium subterraneum]|uniref:RNase H type-1 domain-containing protein n=1 Tax=Trifolium subterraneum TaxID=3900 RepID=A0A2Z6M1Y0_TRISU|nr:hypothetical protein TSUD_361370 [Trifolium subterraneum]
MRGGGSMTQFCGKMYDGASDDGWEAHWWGTRMKDEQEEKTPSENKHIQGNLFVPNEICNDIQGVNLLRACRWCISDDNNIKVMDELWFRVEDGRWKERRIVLYNKYGRNNDLKVSMNKQPNDSPLWKALVGIGDQLRCHTLVIIPTPKDKDGPDLLGWSGTSTRQFTVQSAYDLQRGNNLAIEGNWKSLWRWNRPHKIQTFMWITTHERLLTNFRRSRWGNGTSPTCPACGQEDETILHVLRDCMDLIFVNISGAHTKDWHTIFMVTCWMWRSLPRQYGNCLSSFARKIDSCDALHAEMWGMYIRMDLARRQGITHLQVESDSNVLVDMVTKQCNVNGNIPTLVKRIHDLKNMNWHVQFNHTWREGNRSADWLANFSLTLNSYDMQVLETPPRELKRLLFYDTSGACMPQSVYVVS